MPKIRAGEIEIHYEIHGTGEPLVLISGLGYDLWMWHKMVPGLAEHFQVIAFDNRGAGETDKPAGPYTAQMLAGDTAALLEALGLEQAAIMGHSMGGFVAQALVLSRPELVSKLILSATNFGGPHHVPITPEAMAVLTDTQSDPIERLRRGIVISTAPGFAEVCPEIIDEWVTYRIEHPIDPAGYQAQLQIGLALMSEAASFEHKLKEVKTPTLILFGEHDKVVPPGNAELLHKEIAGSTVKILPNAGHFFPFEVPDEAVEAVIEFLKA
ncbi:MAG: alpha/beta fold hydrolase [Anaerolineae bacterium]|jgi:pimeloyl-ACP methyl ester carboxylesterase